MIHIIVLTKRLYKVFIFLEGLLSVLMKHAKLVNELVLVMNDRQVIFRSGLFES